MTNTPYEKDVADYKDYCSQWILGTLTNDHPVMVMMTYWSRVAAYKYDCLSQLDDLRDEALLSLATESRYEGRCSLATYVVQILRSKVRIVKRSLVPEPAKPRKDQSQQNEPRLKYSFESLDAERIDGDERGSAVLELADEASHKIAEKTLRRLALDELLRDKFAVLPELPRAIVEIVLRHEEYLSSRRLAEEATKQLGRKVTRYQVEVALAQLAIVIGGSLWLL